MTGTPAATNVLYTRSKVSVRSCWVVASKRVNPAMFTLNGQKP